MLEAEPSSGYSIVVVKDNVKGVLLATHAITLTTFTLYLYFHEFGHLVVETHYSCLITAAGTFPNLTRLNEILEGSDPGVDWGKNSVIERS